MHLSWKVFVEKRGADENFLIIQSVKNDTRAKRCALLHQLSFRLFSKMTIDYEKIAIWIFWYVGVDENLKRNLKNIILYWVCGLHRMWSSRDQRNYDQVSEAISFVIISNLIRDSRSKKEMIKCLVSVIWETTVNDIDHLFQANLQISNKKS